jgi:hypothetical protein
LPGEGNALMVMDGDAMAAAANTKARAKIVADAFPTMEFVNDVWCVHLQLHPPVRSVVIGYEFSGQCVQQDG